jgi:hypothetical protein
MKILHFEDLECWKEARKLVNMVYEAIRESKAFQNDYRLKDQGIGAATSVMGTIPEGFARRSNREFIQYLFISMWHWTRNMSARKPSIEFTNRQKK